MAIIGKDVMKLVISVRDDTRGAFAKVGTQIQGLKGHTGRLNTGFEGLKGTMGNLSGAAGKFAGALGPLGIAGVAVAAVAAVGMFATSAVKSFTAFEDSMANVRKTTGMTKEETNALGASIDGLALRLPVAHGELAKIAAIAGQLGIQGKANILGFTEDIAKMSTAFDMSAESAATAIAKMANIYDIPIENVSALGSAINILGNTTAAQESAIMDFAMSLGASAKQLGFCETEAVAMGATLISMGMDASASGTRLNAAFTQMAKNLDKVSSFLGISEDKFREAFGKDPMAMVTQIVTKLAQIEDPLERAAAGAEMFGLIGAKSINALGGDLDGLQTNLANAAKGFEENTSLTEEFAAKTDTLKAKFALVGNAAESLKINIGAALAPLAGTLAEGVSRGISGISKAFTGMQKVAGPLFKLLFAQFYALKAFMEGLSRPIVEAFKPLRGLFVDTGSAVEKLNVVLNVLKDVFTIITGVAKMLGSILGTLLAKAITPLVAKIQEGIATLTDLYNKLGPIKGLIEGFKDKVVAGTSAVGRWADSFEETAPPVEKLKEAVVELGEEAKKIAPVLTDSIKTLGSRLTEASGNYKTAISNITKEIDTLKDAWNLASDDQKRAIEKQIGALVGVRDEMTRGKEDAEKYHKTLIEGTEKATEMQEQFTVKLGKTTVTFKGMAAEVVKNADAYAALQEKAKAILDLDWSIFVSLEEALPDINDGIGNMESAFTGLKNVLEENIANLESVKTSVMEISEIAAPFLEEGFLNGIKAISNFAGALSEAGNAINTFAGLQEVSIDGCIDFSLHVNDMVSALQILEDQMGDLVPAFGNMDTLITNIADAFLYSGGKIDSFISEFDNQMSNAYKTMDDTGVSFNEFRNIVDGAFETKSMEYWSYAFDKFLSVPASRFNTLGESIRTVDMKITGANDTAHEFLTTTKEFEDIDYRYTFEHQIVYPLQSWARENYNVEISLEDVYELMSKPPEEQKKWLDDLMHSEKALTFQMDKQTGALKKQTDQLAKITDALAPYLEFMRTLNELAELSAVSTDDLNQGLNAISDTLMNLSKSLSTFNLEPAMQALFDSGEEGESSAKAFTDTMLKHSSDFNTLINYIEKLSTAIITLTGAFESFRDINKSALADKTALIALFGDITDIMENFSSAMNKSGVGDKLASGIEKMVSSAAPLSTYFQNNNAAVTEFNNTLSAFKSVLGSVVDTMDSLLKMSAMTVPEVDDLASGFDKAADFVRTFNDALMMHVGAKEGAWDMEKYFDSVFSSIENLASSWKALTYDMGNSFETFEDAASTITGVINAIISLSDAFVKLGDISIPTSTEIAAVLDKIQDTLKKTSDILHTKMWTDITTEMADFNTQWIKVNGNTEENSKSFESFQSVLTSIIGTAVQLTNSLADVSKIAVISSNDMSTILKDIPTVLSNLTTYLGSPNFANIQKNLEALNDEYAKHKNILEKTILAYEDVTGIVTNIINGILNVNTAFVALNETTILTEQDMGKAFENIALFVSEFTGALSSKFGGIITELRLLNIEWKKHSEEMGTLMLAYTDSVSVISTLVEGVTSLTSALQSLSKTSAISAPEFDTGFLKIIESIGNFSTALKNNVDTLIVSLQKLRIAWLENETVLVPLMIDFIIITKNFKSLADNAMLMNNSFSAVSENASSLEAGFDSLISIIEKVVNGTKNFYTPGTASGIAQFIVDIGFVIGAFKVLGESINVTMKNIQSDITWSVNDISTNIRRLATLTPNMFVYGSNLMFSFIGGIKSWKNVLIAEMQAIANIIKSYLGVSSPTELGPLRDLEKWPKNLVKSFATGIKSELPTLNASFSNMALPAVERSVANSGNSTNVVINVVQNVTNRNTADYAAKELERIIAKHEIL